MAKMHIHVSVDNLEKSIKFYNSLFGSKPSKQKKDYAKWELEDPKINLAISERGTKPGVDHLGLQAETEEEMAIIRKRIKSSNLETFNEGETTCCYAVSDKSWLQDPSGLPWETYHTMEDASFFNESPNEETGVCCAPEIK
ncbi:MAG: glyoxalase/bleomycin resistance/dioxygenase family protein [Gammaproteobacteria bacterium]|jgi:hypothetical protein|nr:glyoxalase/bleomycin resistance/dioxygenase family protein [Gammaproteobacteria bacterium]|tara:strand:+ start:1077 stop:1499 length:423 start_codon:yes stop_codon:yes gene_type:complete